MPLRAHVIGCTVAALLSAACSANTPIDTSADAGTTCVGPKSRCGNSCVDLQTDVQNCGACGATCVPPSGVTAQCNAGVCETCYPGHADCNGNSADGCETEIESNPESCGACGRSCQGAACSSGLCETLVMVSGVTVVGLARDSTHLYWTNGASEVGRVPLGGGLQSRPLSSRTNRTIASDGDYLYYSVDANVMRVPTSGGSTETVAATVRASGVEDLMLHGAHVYWAQNDGSLVRALKGANQTAEELIPWPGTGTINSLATDGTNIFFSSAGALFYVPIGGGTPQTATGGAGGTHLELLGNSIYWRSGNWVRSFDAVNGGAVKTLASEGVATGLGFAVDDSGLYWASYRNGAFAIQKLAHGSATPQLVSTTGTTAVPAIVLTATHVYWGDTSTQTISRVAK